jgi:hypothetical protein
MAAQLRIRDAGGVLRTISRVRMRDAGGTLRTIQQIRMRDAGGTLRTVFSYISLSLNLTYISAVNSGASASGTTTSSVITGTVSGGTGPFTYAWARVSGDTQITAGSPTAAATTFSATCYDAVEFSTVFRLTVTDANGATATADITVDLTWVDTR